jgi:microcystin-dependent protein
VQRPDAEMAVVQPSKQLAHAAFMQPDAKLGGNAVTQIGTAEPHNAVAGEIGAFLNPRCNLTLFYLTCPVFSDHA